MHKGSKEAVSSAEFRSLLSLAEQTLKEMGRRVYTGDAEVSPYRRGTVTACEQCLYHGICRIDPWTHRFRLLSKPELLVPNVERAEENS